MAVVVAELAARLGLKVDRKSWSIGNDVIGGLGKALAVFVGYKVIRSMKDFVTSTLNVGDNAVKAGQKLGITAEAVQELSYAAGQSGSSFEEISAALSRFAVGMEEVRKTGKGPTADALRSLGIRMRDLKGETLDQNLEAIADRFAKLPDGAKKTALAMQLFGKSGANLIPFLNQGSKGVVALRAEAQELGVVIGEDAAKEMENVGDDVDRVKTSLVGLRNQAVVALMPTIRELVTSLLGWIKANRQMLGTVVRFLASGLASALSFLGHAIAFVVEHWKAIALSLGGPAIVITILYLRSLFRRLREQLKKSVAWAVANAPLLLIALGVAALVYAFLKFRKQTVAVLNWIKERFFALGRWIKGHWYLLLLGPFMLIGAAIVTVFGHVWAKIKEGAMDLVKWIKSLPERAWDTLTGSVDINVTARQLKNKSGAPLTPQVTAVMDTPGRPRAPVATRTAVAAREMTFADLNITVPVNGTPDDYKTAVRQGFADAWSRRMRPAAVA